MTETLVNMALVLAGSVAGIFLVRKISTPLQERFLKIVGLFILALGLRVFVKYHQPVIVLVSLVLGAGLGFWWKMGLRTTALGNFFLPFLSKKHLLPLSPAPFNEGFVTASLLYCVGPLALLAGFPSEGHHVLAFSMKWILVFLSALLFTSTMGWGVMLSTLSLLVIQVALSLSGDPVQSFFSENLVLDLTGTGGILIALSGLRVLKLTLLEPADFLPALLVCPLVSWAYYSLA
jgi:uncharacterized protein